MRLISNKGLGWLSLVGLLLVTSLACNLGNMRRFGITKPTTEPVSTQAAGQLVNNIEDAIATAEAGGTVTLELTEEQLTSLAVLEMQKAGSNEIQNLQIRLRDGLVRISGTVNQSGISLKAVIDVAIKIDAQGKPHSEIVSARVGPFPVPSDMLDELTSMLDRYLLEQISSSGKQLVIEHISINDGKLTLVGKLQ